MKIVRRGALPVGGESGLLDVRDRARRGRVARSRARRRYASEDIWAALRRPRAVVRRRRALRPLRVVIDAANGMAGAMLPPVLERLPMLDVVRCYFEPDGTFPNHEPNPLLPENREFIVAQDDARRAPTSASRSTATPTAASSSTTRGEFVPGDFTTALFAESILAKEPGGKVIYDVRASWAVPEAILAAGGEPLVNRVGHAFIKQRMREEGAVFGGEVSAHYYFRDFSQADSGTVPFLLMCELVSRRGKLSEVLAPFRARYFITGEINTPVADVAAKLQELEERYVAEGRSRTSTACRSRRTTGTSTCARRTRSRSSG